MKSKILWASVIPAGFAIFSMLFGSGNIMFPIHTGKITGSNFAFGTIGFLLTGILMPVIGLLGVVLAKGDTRNYFKELPYPLYFLLISFLLALLGPFFVVPRCIHTAYGGIAQFTPVPFWVFSAFFTCSLFMLSYDHSRVVGLIGKFISPFKIGGIAIITLGCLYFAPDVISNLELSSWQGFLEGMQQGYQTMDLPASLFFSAAIYAYLGQVISTDSVAGRRQLLKNAALACVIGESIIAVVYICFVKLGASYAPILNNLSMEMYFPVLAKTALGSYALLLIAFTLFFSCLATALILVDLYTSYLHEDIFRKKLPRFVSMLMTCGIGYGISLMGCGQLCNFFVPILTYVYPTLVVFAIYKLFRIYMQTRV